MCAATAATRATQQKGSSDRNTNYATYKHCQRDNLLYQWFCRVGERTPCGYRLGSRWHLRGMSTQKIIK